MLDLVTRRVIYSRGFASIFGEWQDTNEAKQLRRAFHESVRFPIPASPVQVVIQGRGPDSQFRDLWSVRVDPSDAGIDRSGPPKLKVSSVVHNGAPRDK